MAEGKETGGFLRRLLFLILLLLVIAGIAGAGYLLNQRLGEANRQIASLEAELEKTQADLKEMQAGLEELQQVSSDMAKQNETALAALEEDLTYSLLLERAQAEVLKAQLSLIQENVGQARREISVLQAALTDAQALAGEEDADTLQIVQDRLERTREELGRDTANSLNDLESTWIDLDKMAGGQLSVEAE